MSEPGGDEQVSPVGLRQLDGVAELVELTMGKEDDRRADPLAAQRLLVVAGLGREPVEQLQDAVGGTGLREVPPNASFEPILTRHDTTMTERTGWSAMSTNHANVRHGVLTSPADHAVLAVAAFATVGAWLTGAAGGAGQMAGDGLRHTHKTLMEELGTPGKLMDERMGHEDGSVQARYSHITPVMRRQLLDGLTRLWVAALDVRRALYPRSPVDVLDRLLTAKRPEVGE
jgi:hypothetical protein